MKVYLDNAATTKLHPKVYEAMLPYLKENFGNPSSIHSFGRKVRVVIEESREIVANSINADPSEIYFVSNGTEANNFPIFGIAKTEFNDSGKNHIITSIVEHQCVLEPFQKLVEFGFTYDFIPVINNGEIDHAELAKKISNSTNLVSLIHINNETGAVNHLKQISKILYDKKAYLHTDTVQSYGKIKIDVKELGVDSLSASAHKFYGPKGIGFVYGKSGTPLSPLIYGGSQERNRRGGTENPAAIIGLAEAVKIAESEMVFNNQLVCDLRKSFVEGIKSIDDKYLSINSNENSSPYVISLTFSSEKYKNNAESYLMFLDINGIAASNGAACTSGTLKPSHVILGIGKSVEDANGTIRFSLAPYNTLEEIEYTLEVIAKMTKQFSKF